MDTNLPLLLSGGNLSAMREMERVQQKLSEDINAGTDAVATLTQYLSIRDNDTETQQQTSGISTESRISVMHDQPNSSYTESSSEQVIRSTSLDADAIGLQNQASASSIAPRDETISCEAISEAPVSDNEQSTGSIAPESANVACQVRSNLKIAKRERREELLKKFRDQRIERRRHNGQTKVRPKYVKPKRLNAKEAAEKAIADKQELWTSANEQATSTLKRRYSWMVAPSKVVGEGNGSSSRDRTAEISNQETTSPSQRRHTMM